MTQYDLGKVVGDKGDDGNGIASITKTSTSGLVDTYTITYDDGDTDTFTVTNGSDASVDIVTSFSSTTSDSKVPSEKLTKNKLDLKADLQHSHGNIGSAGRMSGYSKNVVTDSSGYITTENKPTIPTDVSDLTDNSNTAFTPKSHTHTVSQVTDFPSLGAVATTDDYDDLINKPTIPSDLSDLSDLNSLLFSGDYDDLDNKPTIPSASTDLSDTASLVRTSNTTGLIKNDGTVDTSTYLTSSSISGKEDTTNKVTSWSSTTTDTHYPSEKLVKNGLDGKQATLVSGTNIKYINGLSILGSGDLTIEDKRDYYFTKDSFFDPAMWFGNVSFSNGVITITSDAEFSLRLPPNCSLSFKVTIPQDYSENLTLFEGSNVDLTYEYLEDGVAYIYFNVEDDYITYGSEETGDGFSSSNATSLTPYMSFVSDNQTITISEVKYTTANFNELIPTSDIADNLTTNNASKVLSAKQGYVLAGLIGDAITYINQ